MKSVKVKGNVSKEHPMHKLYEAASDIIARTVSAYDNAKVFVPDSYSIPIWIDSNPVMKITIEVGTKTTAEYAIFKAQKK